MLFVYQNNSTREKISAGKSCLKTAKAHMLNIHALGRIEGQLDKSGIETKGAPPILKYYIFKPVMGPNLETLISLGSTSSYVECSRSWCD